MGKLRLGKLASMPNPPRPGSQAGVTLTELMITVAIIGILATVAYPSYRDYVTRTNRSEARENIVELASVLERCRTRYGAYNNGNCPIQDGGTATSQEGNYQFAFDVDSAEFSIVAKPVAGSVQADDTTCAKFSYNQLGSAKVVNSGGTDTTEQCW